MQTQLSAESAVDAHLVVRHVEQPGPELQRAPRGRPDLACLLAAPRKAQSHRELHLEHPAGGVARGFSQISRAGPGCQRPGAVRPVAIAGFPPQPAAALFEAEPDSPPPVGGRGGGGWVVSETGGFGSAGERLFDRGPARGDTNARPAPRHGNLEPGNERRWRGNHNHRNRDRLRDNDRRRKSKSARGRRDHDLRALADELDVQLWQRRQLLEFFRDARANVDRAGLFAAGQIPVPEGGESVAAGLPARDLPREGAGGDQQNEEVVHVPEGEPVPQRPGQAAGGERKSAAEVGEKVLPDGAVDTALADGRRRWRSAVPGRGQ
mmetsp:Transcript_13847/g.34148  ORF Transcript_13847/g.34148 Transcript_13847/m.34148 type:complete len:322 (-) Transcript_13847:1124-2089(-)